MSNQENTATIGDNSAAIDIGAEVAKTVSDFKSGSATVKTLREKLGKASASRLSVLLEHVATLSAAGFVWVAATQFTPKGAALNGSWAETFAPVCSAQGLSASLMSHLRTALQGGFAGIAPPKGCNKLEAYTKHVRATMPEGDREKANSGNTTRGADRKGGKAASEPKPDATPDFVKPFEADPQAALAGATLGIAAYIAGEGAAATGFAELMRLALERAANIPDARADFEAACKAIVNKRYRIKA